MALSYKINEMNNYLSKQFTFKDRRDGVEEKVIANQYTQRMNIQLSGAKEANICLEKYMYLTI